MLNGYLHFPLLELYVQQLSHGRKKMQLKAICMVQYIAYFQKWGRCLTKKNLRLPSINHHLNRMLLHLLHSWTECCVCLLWKLHSITVSGHWCCQSALACHTVVGHNATSLYCIPQRLRMPQHLGNICEFVFRHAAYCNSAVCNSTKADPVRKFVFHVPWQSSLLCSYRYDWSLLVAAWGSLQCAACICIQWKIHPILNFLTSIWNAVLFLILIIKWLSH